MRRGTGAHIAQALQRVVAQALESRDGSLVGSKLCCRSVASVSRRSRAWINRSPCDALGSWVSRTTVILSPAAHFVALGERIAHPEKASVSRMPTDFREKATGGLADGSC